MGTVDRNVGGQPVYLAGRMRDVSAEPRRNTASGDPKP
jgi:hypothetical protein